MKSKFLRLLIGCIVLQVGLILGSANCFGVLNTITQPTKTALINNYTITWGKTSELVFNGNPNESRTGEITYTIHTNFKCEKYLVSITGAPFMNGDTLLETNYQSGNDQSWHKAGDAFMVRGTVGKVSKLRFQASSGPKISSQLAGVYTAKITINVISFE